jgi:hypothetical protein
MRGQTKLSLKKSQLRAEILSLKIEIDIEEAKDFEIMNHAKITRLINHRDRLQNALDGKKKHTYQEFTFLT